MKWKQMNKDNKNEYSNLFQIPLAVLSGYAIIFLVAFLFHTDFNVTEPSITGFAIANRTVTEQDASLALGKANQILAEMSSQGFGVARVKDLIEEARREMVMKNYEKVILLTDEISDLKQKAADVQAQIKNAKSIISDAKKNMIDATEPEALLNLSIVEFALENYEGSQNLIESSIGKLKINTEEEIKIILGNLYILKNNSLNNGFNSTRLRDTISNAENALKTAEQRKIRELKPEFLNLNSSINLLIVAKKDIDEMAEAGLGISRISASFNEAKLALELGFYDRIEPISKNIRELELRAFDIDLNIKKAEAKIDEARRYGVEINEAYLLLNSSKNEFELENYEEAEKLLKQSFETAEKIVSESLLFGTISKSELRISAINFLKKFWWLILIIATIFYVLGFIVFQRVSIAMLEHILKRLQSEQEGLIELIRKVQTSYFKDKTIDKSTYELTINKYQDRIIQIKEKMPLLKEKLARKRDNALKLNGLIKKLIKKKDDKPVK